MDKRLNKFKDSLEKYHPDGHKGVVVGLINMKTNNVFDENKEKDKKEFNKIVEKAKSVSSVIQIKQDKVNMKSEAFRQTWRKTFPSQVVPFSNSVSDDTFVIHPDDFFQSLEQIRNPQSPSLFQETMMAATFEYEVKSGKMRGMMRKAQVLGFIDIQAIEYTILIYDKKPRPPGEDDGVDEGGEGGHTRVFLGGRGKKKGDWFISFVESKKLLGLKVKIKNGYITQVAGKKIFKFQLDGEITSKDDPVPNPQSKYVEIGDTSNHTNVSRINSGPPPRPLPAPPPQGFTESNKSVAFANPMYGISPQQHQPQHFQQLPPQHFQQLPPQPPQYHQQQLPPQHFQQLPPQPPHYQQPQPQNYMFVHPSSPQQQPQQQLYSNAGGGTKQKKKRSKKQKRKLSKKRISLKKKNRVKNSRKRKSKK